MKTFLFIAVTVLMSSCLHDSLTKTTTTNGINVEYMFEKDSIRVYRFYDDGRYHYFTTRGETITTQQEGKNYNEENIK